uniref:Elongin-C n=1 Tax=Helicotheca tamesis TaxID=374047 RepID=A0A7S2MPC7_9STRA|mmetsp:Transcript_19397/g.26621  ORF Transcript_19397/g.26621 Transcript_19397/m.26621 type:complete len:112 (+) Transcript_19397:141-476(+)|eukprot:CAMPEP_0185729138 /NCGR_PEP_ID=MMETSP1171-20130828/4490_1 /TAXON_ID=374046 /ORGANISM="Helicotheca tamensis, Strain CCMP826" /LENGTH=111 /DNA_ID=CAMNT_0028397915 /DNA_START=128 /DNA_END=463 /DNA_ORIENTATION=-
MSDDKREEGDSSTNDYVKLISAEGDEFYLLRHIAVSGSETMRAMLEGVGRFRESEESIVRFPDIASHILEKVVQYLQYKVQHSNSTTRIPEFVIEPEIALELLVASNYLNC